MAKLTFTPEDFKVLDVVAARLVREDGVHPPRYVALLQGGHVDAFCWEPNVAKNHGMLLASVHHRPGWRVVRVRHGASGEEVATYLEGRLRALGWGDFEFRRSSFSDG